MAGTIEMTPKDVAQWLGMDGPGGFGDPYEGLRTSMTQDEADGIVATVVGQQMAEEPGAPNIEFNLLREALLGGGFHLALCMRLLDPVEDAFQAAKADLAPGRGLR